MIVKEYNADIAGKQFWDKTERNRDVEMEAFNPDGRSVRQFGRRMWHNAFQTAFAGLENSDLKLLELGCGGSAFLPYFARRFGFKVSGIDYSENGCDLARRMCTLNGVHADITCANFFESLPDLESSFDVVVSFGVVEHFTNLEETLRAFSRFLKPAGLIVTTVPNLTGIPGKTFGWLSKDLFDKHMVFSLDRFRDGHEAAGFSIIKCEPLLFINFGVINPGPNAGAFKRLCFSGLRAITGLAWALESLIGPFTPNCFTSPYLMCVARNRSAVADE
jgi:2-polyprenyl-3-methyl-5-hydroxy-6-metoxy-1,4-benzoquinol methylase